MNIIKNQNYDKERELYNLKDTRLVGCTFRGITDGESPLKEARNIEIDSCAFSLRYPLWHVDTFKMDNTVLNEFARAPIWYCKHAKFTNCTLNCIKAVRECEDIQIDKSSISSNEFGWKSSHIQLSNTNITSEYIFLDSKNVILKNVKFKGKYSFQYMKNLIIEDSVLDTKDAFWHSEHVIVKNSVVKGEYLGWYSKDLTFINCTIIGTQPLCYAKKLRLENCKMIDTDLAFEYSEVEASISSSIKSIKNPKSGKITCDFCEELILEDSLVKDTCEIIETKK